MVWFLAKKPALGRRVAPDSLMCKCSGRTDRAWISEHLRPHATARRKAVLWDSSSRESLWREEKPGVAKNCKTNGRSHLGARHRFGGLRWNMPLIRLVSVGLLDTVVLFGKP